MREEKEEKKTRTTIDVNKEVWAKVREEAYKRGETVSDVVERRLTESYKAVADRIALTEEVQVMKRKVENKT